jgi:hypothetical protein
MQRKTDNLLQPCRRVTVIIIITLRTCAIVPQKWLTKLTNESYDTTAEKQARNIYLSQLILNMDERKLSAPFTSVPSSHPFSLDGVFKHITAKPFVELEKDRTVSV